MLDDEVTAEQLLVCLRHVADDLASVLVGAQFLALFSQLLSELVHVLRASCEEFLTGSEVIIDSLERLWAWHLLGAHDRDGLLECFPRSPE